VAWNADELASMFDESTGDVAIGIVKTWHFYAPLFIWLLASMWR